jgi:hypothetical protein
MGGICDDYYGDFLSFFIIFEIRKKQQQQKKTMLYFGMILML